MLDSHSNCSILCHRSQSVVVLMICKCVGVTEVTMCVCLLLPPLKNRYYYKVFNCWSCQSVQEPVDELAG